MRKYLGATIACTFSLTACALTDDTQSALTESAYASSALSSVGGSISADEVHDRAEYWYQRRDGFTYNGTYYDMHYDSGRHTFTPDPAGRLYANDCLGFVSMTWHLNSSLNTGGFNELFGGNNDPDHFRLGTHIDPDNIGKGDAVMKLQDGPTTSRSSIIGSIRRFGRIG